MIHVDGQQPVELKAAYRYRNANGSNSYVTRNQIISLNGLGGYTTGDAGTAMPLAGEKLGEVAQRLYGSSSMWYVLADANGLSDGA